MAEFGKLYKINDCYVYCGDSYDTNTIINICKQIDLYCSLCITSPPYALQRKNEYGGISEDKYVEWFEHIQETIKSLLIPNGNFILNIKPNCNKDNQRSLYVFDLIIAMVRQWGWYFIDEFCWIKTAVPKQVKAHFKNGFEPVYHFALNNRKFVFNPKDVMIESNSAIIPGGPGIGATTWSSKQGSSGNYLLSKTKGITHGMAYPSNVLNIRNSDRSNHHPAAYPVKLVDFFVKSFSNINDFVLDPFGGSGTTAISCIRNNRKCLIIEKVPRYIDICLDRISKEYGLQFSGVEEIECSCCVGE